MSRAERRHGRARRLRAGFVLLAGAMLLLAAPGLAKEGRGLVVDVEIAQGRMTMHDGTVLVVSPQTRMAGPQGQRLSLSDFPVSSRTEGGGVAGHRDGWVVWSGTSSGGSEIAAGRIELRAVIPK